MMHLRRALLCSALFSACADVDVAAEYRAPRADDGNGEEGEGEEGEGEEGEGEEGEGGEGEGEGVVDVDCAAGLVAVDGDCRAVGPAALTARSEASVCAKWNSDYRWVTEWSDAGVVDQCSAGEVPQEALDNGLRRVNLYRWLVGVDAAALEPSLFEQQQACATLMAAYGQLTHFPSAEMPCYSSSAAAGAGSSNIAGGGGIAGSVDMYVSDFGAGNAASLGHRRWTIGPFMSVTQFGVRNGYSCMYSFGLGGGRDPGFVAYPPPGFVPASAAPGDFSFESATLGIGADAVVEVAVDDAAFAVVEHRVLQGNYGHYGTAIAWAPPAGAFLPGTRVRVRITPANSGPIEYTVMFAGC
jgi:hypothetical protein